MSMRGLAASVLAVVVVAATAVAPARGQALRLGAPAPELTGTPWINSGPLTLAGLRGRVVLVDFWTFG